MDQRESETLTSSENNEVNIAASSTSGAAASGGISSKLNARAPEFVPRSAPPPPPSSASITGAPPHHVLQNLCVRPPPPAFVPPPYYSYESQPPVRNYFQQSAAVPPSYGYGNRSPVEAIDAGETTKNGLPDAHQKILNQVEFYFSDINLATTDHLFRFMSKDPEGYVPVSVVSSFKKIKTVINGNEQLAYILRSSTKLLVSEDGKKVKCQHPLTETDMEELQSRIIVAENLPEDHCHQNLMKIFSSVGSVKSIRTCPPQVSNGGASSASRTAKGESIPFSNKLHAFVEYESVELAEKAVAELNDEGNWRNGLKVRLLLKCGVKSAQSRGKKAHEGHNSSKKDEANVSEGLRSKERHLEDSARQSDGQLHEIRREDKASNSSSRKGRSYNSGKSKGHGRGRPQQHFNGGNSLGASPLDIPVNSVKQTVAKISPVPRMPDGTKGFSMGRGKPVIVNIA